MMDDRADLLEQPVVRDVPEEEDPLPVNVNASKTAPTDRDDRAHACSLDSIKDDGRHRRRVRDGDRSKAAGKDNQSRRRTA